MTAVSGGFFITLEGGEGAGKSTQASLLALRLASLGIGVHLTREPGGSPGAEIIRHLLLSGLGKLLGPDAETLLFAAARDDLGETLVDGALFDFGVSSMQFDRPERGFSLQHDGPVDMRMNAGTGPSAYDLLATLDERELADAIFTYGEERAARRIAHALVAARAANRLPERTLALAGLIAGVVQVRGKRERVHPATRTFQALRIAVNDELGSLERGLDAAIERTHAGGRIAAISFHSLEDRIVKRRFRDDERVRPLTKKPLLAGDDELARNPRARSAKLRVAERLP